MKAKYNLLGELSQRSGGAASSDEIGSERQFVVCFEGYTDCALVSASL